MVNMREFFNIAGYKILGKTRKLYQIRQSAAVCSMYVFGNCVEIVVDENDYIFGKSGMVWWYLFVK